MPVLLLRMFVAFAIALTCVAKGHSQTATIEDPTSNQDLIKAENSSLDPLAINQQVPDSKHVVKLLGKCDLTGLQEAPYSDWFTAGFDHYLVDSDMLDRCKDKLENIRIVVFMGTWCEDSQQQVPRFVKVMNYLGITPSRLQLTCIDYVPGRYKRSPFGEEAAFGIHRVPAIIVFRGEKELGRMVESPVTSLEVDLAQMLHDMAPSPKYALVPKVQALIAERGAKHVLENMEHLSKEFAGIDRGFSELNTLAKVYSDCQQFQEALAILKLNATLHSQDAKAIFELGMGYSRTGQVDVALIQLAQSITLNPCDPEAAKQLERLSQAMSQAMSQADQR